MEKKKKALLIAVIGCVVLMFAFIFLTVFLTGEREIEAFTGRDKAIFGAFVAAEAVTCVAVFYFAVQLGKLNRQPAPPVSPEKLPKRGALLLLGALSLALCLFLLGVKLPIEPTTALWGIFAACCLLPLLLLGASVLLSKLMNRSLLKKNVRQMQAFLVSHREDARRTAMQKLMLLRSCRRLTDLYAAVLLLLGVGVCLLGGMLVGTDLTVPVCFYGAFLLQCCFCRIRFSDSAEKTGERPELMPAQDYPEFYGLARRAADCLAVKGDIRICMDGSFSAGIAYRRDHCEVWLGVTLLSVLSQEELYAVLLHEFSHAVQDEREGKAERLYHEWLCGERNPHFLSGMTGAMYAFPDAVYGMQYGLYFYASSIQHEQEADRAMADHGDVAAAGTGLIKLKYGDLNDWELNGRDQECAYAPETPDESYLEKRIAQLHEALGSREPVWRELIDREILARSASHPTVKMRLEALGVTDRSISLPQRTGAFAREYEKALQMVQRRMVEAVGKDYADLRRKHYLEPLELVQRWEAEGCPLAAESYADIHDALRSLGRNADADSLCLRVLQELSGAACDHARFMHGCYLLTQFDDGGLACIYQAMEGNSNYIEEGLSIIGDYCCVTGNQQELDTYREKAVELLQKDRDVYSQLNVLKKTDRLSAEQLPEGMLEDILAHIRKVEEGSVQAVYLVRKTITEDFFASVFVIRFFADTDEDLRDKVMHRVFCYLDTCSDWQFALFEYDNVADVKPENITGSCVYSPQR